MGYTIVQTATPVTNVSGPPVTITFGQNFTPGNVVLVSVVQDTNGNFQTAVVDNNVTPNALQGVGSISHAATMAMAYLSYQVPLGTVANAISVTQGAVALWINGYEISGIDAARGSAIPGSGVDQLANAYLASAATNTLSLTEVGDGDFVIFSYGAKTGTSTSITATGMTGITALSVNSSSSTVKLADFWAVGAAAGGTDSPKLTWTNSGGGMLATSFFGLSTVPTAIAPRSNIALMRAANW